MAIFVVPVQLEAKEFGTYPVFRYSVKGAERVPKLLFIFLSNILYTEVIDDERKDDVPGFVALQRLCVLDGGVAKLSSVLDESVVGNAAGLLQSEHAIADFHIDPSVVLKAS